MAWSLEDLDEAIGKLEAVRGSRVLLLVWQPGQSGGVAEAISAADVEPLYRCLRRLGHVERLDVVLHAPGGSTTAAAKLANLLADTADRLAFLVPSIAHGAGTVLALAGDEIVMGPLAELSPLDPWAALPGPVPGTPAAVSAQEIRAFRAMAAEWFGIGDGETGVHALGALCAQVHPTTLARLYRAGTQLRRTVLRLLRRSMAGRTADEVAAVADRLLSGHYGPDEVIDRTEAAAAGLLARPPLSDEEADRLWDVWEAAQDHLAQGAPATVLGDRPRTTGLMLCHEAIARCQLVEDGDAGWYGGWQVTIRTQCSDVDLLGHTRWRVA